MDRSVIGVFGDRSNAESAINDLKQRGFDENEVSIIMKDGAEARGGIAGENVGEGVAWGGALGGLAGVLAGAGAIAVPGIGPILAAGPIAAALSGALTGGVAGGLLDLGIPEARGRYYESRVREGDILAVVRADENKINNAANVLRKNGASDVEVHDVPA